MPMKQYVNFDQAHEDVLQHEGARVHLRVTRKLWTGFLESMFSSAETRRLEWVAVPDGGNIPTDIVCQDSPAAVEVRRAYPIAVTKAAAPPAPVFGQTVTSEGLQGDFRNTVKLPHTGGDKFKVRAYKLDSDRARTETVVAVEEIETWRRIYYDFYCANDACEQLYARIKARLASYYEPAFIELVESRTGNIADAPVTLVPLGTLFSGKAALGHAPNHLRLGLVDQWGKKVDATIDMLVRDTGAGNDKAAAATASRAADSGVWSFRARLQARSVFPMAGWNKGIKLVQQNEHDAGFTEIPRAIDEVGEAFTFTRTAGDDVTITVASDSLNQVLTAAARPCRVEIKLGYNQLLGGSSGGTNIAITRLSLFDPDDTDEADNGILIAFLHEIGHSIGMVDTASPKFYFDNHGGRGPHCATAADRVPLNTDRWNEIPRDETASGEVYLPNVAGVGQCVMYHSRWTRMNASVFCAECVKVMRRMKISVRQ
jgi:hypothetical protein